MVGCVPFREATSSSVDGGKGLVCFEASLRLQNMLSSPQLEVIPPELERTLAAGCIPTELVAVPK